MIKSAAGSAKPACEICKKEFGLVRRPHKCKRCKRTVCADCATGKAVVILTFEN